MKEEYRDKMYDLSFTPQWKMLRKERGYHEVVSEGGRYLCFQYHMKKRNELLNELFDCRLGRGKYASFSAEEREHAKAILKDREEAHLLKAEIFATLWRLYNELCKKKKYRRLV